MSGKGFRSVREAKDFLADKIAAEAVQEGTPLTEVERKMLYFSETGWTLPDMAEASADFDRDYNQDEYEQKIAGIVRGIQAGDEGRSEEEKEAWYQAVLKLCDGDHYLLVLIDATSPARGRVPSSWERWLPTFDRPAKRDPNDLVRLIVSAFAVLFVAGVIWALGALVFGPDWMHRHVQSR
jgi:cell division protein FtsI/penicillin-binding protein 2